MTLTEEEWRTYFEIEKKKTLGEQLAEQKQNIILDRSRAKDAPWWIRRTWAKTIRWIDSMLEKYPEERPNFETAQAILVSMRMSVRLWVNDRQTNR